MNTILFYTITHANCKQQKVFETKPLRNRFWQNNTVLSSVPKFFSCLQIVRVKDRTVLKGDFYGVRGCCRTCLREKAQPSMRGFRKWRDRNRWVCLCFECCCRRCSRHVYGKCMV
jgi:hypothetical protein